MEYKIIRGAYCSDIEDNLNEEAETNHFNIIGQIQYDVEIGDYFVLIQIV